MVLYEGQNLNNNNDKITNFKFSKSDFGLANMDSHLVVHKKLQENPTRQLIDCLKNLFFKENRVILNCDESNPRNVYKELFKRFITPLYLPLLILISSINLLISKENVNYSKYRFLIFLFGILVIIISESSTGFIQDILFNNYIFVFLPIIFILIIYSTLFYKFKFNRFKI